MKDYLISQYIDDELSLEEKGEFLVEVKNHDDFFNEALSLIENEKIIRRMLHDKELPRIYGYKTGIKKVYKMLSAALVLFIFSFVLYLYKDSIKSNNISYDSGRVISENLKDYRFVLYSNSVSKVEIVGSFTDWKKIELKRVADTGYWEIVLKIPSGDHRYSFIVDGKVMADPTVTLFEDDGFGNINSILEV